MDDASDDTSDNEWSNAAIFDEWMRRVNAERLGFRSEVVQAVAACLAWNKVRSFAGAHVTCILCALQVDSPWLLVFVDVDEFNKQLTTAGQKLCLRGLTFAAFDELDIKNRQA